MADKIERAKEAINDYFNDKSESLEDILAGLVDIEEEICILKDAIECDLKRKGG